MSQHAQYDPYPPVQPAAPRRPRRWPWVLGILVAFVVGAAVGGAGSRTPAASYTPSAPAIAPAAPAAAAPAVEQAAPAAAGPQTTFSDGTYEVGTDIAAGQYKTPGSGGSCYWGRSKNDSGELSAVIANDILGGPGSITVKQGEFVKTSGGCVWTKTR